MLLDRLELTPAQLHESTGWEIKPEGACKHEVCVPLGGIEPAADGTIGAFAERMGMPIAIDEQHGRAGPRPALGRLRAAERAVPDIVLDDFDGNPFDLESLRQVA